MSENKRRVPKLRFPGFTDDWEQRKVGDFYDFKNGLNKGKEFFGSGIPIVNFTDVFNHRGLHMSELKGKVNLQAKEIINFNVQQGDIFFTRTSETIEEIGFPSVMLDKVVSTVFSGFVLRGRAKKQDPLSLLFKQYIFFTDGFRKEMQRKSSMTTRALTSGTAIRQMEFIYPVDIQEQDKIGLLFDSLDILITLHQRKLSHLKRLKAGLLQKMFPRNGETVPEIRFPGFTDAWEQRKFGDIVNRRSEFTTNSSLPHVEYEDIISEIGLLNKDLSQKECDKQGVEFHVGDVLYGKLRPYLHNWLLATCNGIAVGDFWVLAPNTIDSGFLYRLIQSEEFNKISNQSIGTKMPRADWNLVSKTEFYIPSSIYEQENIGHLFEELDHIITLHQRKLENLQKQKKALLQQMFI